MKFDELKAIAHNIADSFEGPFGYPDVYRDASRSEEGLISIDFLTGQIVRGALSDELREVASRYRTTFRELCEKHSTTPEAFSRLIATYGTDKVYGGHYSVEVTDASGRNSVERYHGPSGRRVAPK